jgi:hypothetical protein
MRRRTPPQIEESMDVKNMETIKGICPNPQLLQEKEEKMTEASPNQTEENPQLIENKEQRNLLSPTAGTATSSPKNRN